MTVWADADSLPRQSRELLGRRTRAGAVRAVFVANRAIGLPPGAAVSAVLVGTGDGAADEHICANALPGDILITRDLPLAARAIALGLTAMNDRGEIWSADTLRERLSLRDRARELRELGLAAPMEKSRSFGPREARAFADALDRALTASSRRTS